MVCAPRATSMWNGFAVIVTSDDLIQPVLPFGRTGSSTCTQPSLRSSFTRKTCVTVDVGTSGSYNHGLSNSRAGVDAPGESYTGSFVTELLTVAMCETSAAAMVPTGADVATGRLPSVALPPPPPHPPSAITSAMSSAQQPAGRRDIAAEVTGPLRRDRRGGGQVRCRTWSGAPWWRDPRRWPA